MDPDEEAVKAFLEQKGFTVERFSKEEMRRGKTPDFRVSMGGQFLFYCELKSSPEDQWLDDQLDQAEPGEVVGGARGDPVFNRLTSDVHEAVKQFDAVNAAQVHPNVLVLVNHDDQCTFCDLLAVLTGNFIAADGSTHPIYKKFSEGRIRDSKGKVHLYVWLDDHRPEKLLFTQTHAVNHSKICNYFGIDEAEIRQIE